MIPFKYPAAPFVRRHGPAGYQAYPSFRPWLRDEFSFRCAFCLRRERWEPDPRVFEIDHLRPVSGFPTLAVEYTNLVYSCTVCNGAKGAESVPDPSQVLTTAAVSVGVDGVLVPRTPAARRLIRQLDLNDPQFVDWRRQMIRIVELAAVHDPALHRSLLAYPDDLPDLSVLNPPAGNTRPAGLSESHFQRRANGTLPESY
jgi:hypothetical protein